jgi:hypothetical protein
VLNVVEDLRYPVGPFVKPHRLTTEQRQEMIAQIERLPEELSRAVQGLTDEQLRTRYRPDGWTLIQVLTHVTDSHMNGFVRFKLGLTENAPTIKPYDQHAWSQLPDAQVLDVDGSLTLLRVLHARWVRLARAVDERAYERELIHPESGRLTLDDVIANYAWHGRHHTGHILGARTRNGW